MTSLELRNVTIGSPRTGLLLDDVSLFVADGATVALVGPPGAGTTALLRAVIGLDPVTEGDVLLDDTVVTSLGPRDRDVAAVLQDHPLHPHLDVHDNLAFASRLRRGTDREELAERIDEVAETLALENLLDLRIKELDEPQRQRVAIGRALVRDATLHLFDEAFAAQPERVRAHVRSVTTAWQAEQGRTSVFTTHDPAEALTLADQVVVMHRGVVHQSGTPEQVYREPADVFVAGFVGAPTMNLLPARRVEDQLVTPVATILVDEAMSAALAGRDEVVVGVRPDHWHDASSAQGRDVRDRVEFTSVIEEVEWRGGSQLVLVGFDLDEDVEDRLADLEDAFELDLFQTFCVAELPAEPRKRAGQSVRLVADRSDVHLFDLETGERIAR
ncbi:MAG: ABC transporter ATP-binding protein [Aeromicrobium erythreum]